MANFFRRLLIRFGKLLPFLLCFILLISYSESLIAIYKSDYLSYNESVTLNTPISFMIAQKFEYDWLSVIVLAIISIATQTCSWHKLSVLYLAVHLVFKSYIVDIELTEDIISVLCTLNIIITSLLIYKGIKRL